MAVEVITSKEVCTAVPRSHSAHGTAPVSDVFLLRMCLAVLLICVRGCSEQVLVPVTPHVSLCAEIWDTLEHARQHGGELPGMASRWVVCGVADETHVMEGICPLHACDRAACVRTCSHVMVG